MGRAAMAIWLLVACTTRLWVMWHEPAYLHPDALGQALEPAFRVVTGHGDIAWEWQQGVRSWAWPGLFVPVFALASAFDAPRPEIGMAPWVAAARLVPLALDLVAGWLAIRLAVRQAMAARWSGPLAAIAPMAVAGLTALHPAWVEMAGQPLIDVPAATALLAFCAALTAPAQAPRRSLAIGVAAAVVVMLRVQLLPGVLLGLVLHSPRWAARVGAAPWSWRALVLGACAGMAPFALVDLWTWGAPFASTMAYLRFNAAGGQAAFGTMPPDRYFEHLQLALPMIWPVLGVLAALGARRAPTLAAVLVVTVLSHQLVPMRIWRALHPALWLLPILAGLGAAELAARLQARHRPWWPALAVALLLALGSVGVAARDGTLWRTTWLWNQGGEEAVGLSRALNRAALAVSAGPPVQTVLQAVLPEAAAPGHALFGHDVRVQHPLGRPQGPDLRAVREADVWVVRAAAVPARARRDRHCRDGYGADVLVCWR